MPSLDTNIVVHKVPLNDRSIHVEQKLQRTRLDMVLKVKDEIERHMRCWFFGGG
jgi:hypothetical protein